MTIQYTTIAAPRSLREMSRKRASRIRKQALRNIAGMLKESIQAMPSKLYHEVNLMMQRAIMLLLLTAAVLFSFSIFIAAVNLFTSVAGIG